MIEVEKFCNYLNELFNSKIIYMDRYPSGITFMEVDCMEDAKKKLSIEINSEFVGFSVISKKTEIDFSLHEYYYTSMENAADHLQRIARTGIA